MNPDELPLRDIHLPAALSWWPPAPGWWLLGIFVLTVCVAWVWWRRRRAAIRRAPATLARIDLERLRGSWQEHGDAARLTVELSVWLRRVGMSIAERANVAGLTGERWQQSLNELAGESVFGDTQIAWLTAGPYQHEKVLQGGSAPAAQLLDTCEQWLVAVSRNHRGARP